jgi:uncharacterized protein (DUF433 family)
MYSFPDAARFIGAKPAELRRWLLGYEHGPPNGRTYSEPLWQSQLSTFDIEGLGFKDLIELRFVHTFRESGVPLQLIRATLEAAKAEFRVDYPLTNRKFTTDGRRIFGRTVKSTGDIDLLDLCRRQHVIEKVIGPSLRSGIEFEWGGAARWFPLRTRAIVLDPARKFGQPILAEFDIPTVALWEAVQAEGGDVRRVAHYFEVTPAAVRAAIAFESRKELA